MDTPNFLIHKRALNHVLKHNTITLFSQSELATCKTTFVAESIETMVKNKHKAVIVTDEKVKVPLSADSAYINGASLCNFHANPFEYFSNEFDILDFCFGLIKQCEGPISDTLKENRTLYNRMIYSRRAAAYLLTVAVICSHAFNKDTDTDNFSSTVKLLNECRDDDILFYDYVEQAEAILDSSSVSYYWSIFTEICHIHNISYSIVIAKILTGIDCFYTDIIKDFSSKDDDIFKNVVSLDGTGILNQDKKADIIMIAASSNNNSVPWNIVVYVLLFCLSKEIYSTTVRNRVTFAEPVNLIIDGMTAAGLATGLEYTVMSQHSINLFTINIIVSDLKCLKKRIPKYFNILSTVFSFLIVKQTGEFDKTIESYVKNTILKKSNQKAKVPVRIIKLNKFIHSSPRLLQKAGTQFVISELIFGCKSGLIVCSDNWDSQNY